MKYLKWALFGLLLPVFFILLAVTCWWMKLYEPVATLFGKTTQVLVFDTLKH